jgi:FtsH-binding integral membrane protein
VFHFLRENITTVHRSALSSCSPTIHVLRHITIICSDPLSCGAVFVIVSRYAATEKRINKMSTLFFMWGNTGPRVAYVYLRDVTLTELRLYWSIIAREMF